MSYTIVPSDPRGDRSSVLELWSRNLPGSTPGRYSWLYQTGPAHGWLACSHSDGVVGAAGLMGRTFRTPAGPLEAGQAIDLNVDRRHRMARPALALQEAVTECVRSGQLDFLYGFPNRQSARVLGRAGYRSLGPLRRWVRPLCGTPLLASRFPGRLLPRLAGPGLDVGVALKAALWRPRRRPGIRFSVDGQFGSRFDDLWHRACSQFPVIGQRTAAYLAWRFGRCPQVDYRVGCLNGPGHELLAYAAYSVDAERVAHVADFFFADPASLAWLFCELARHLRRQGVVAIVVVYFGNRLVTDPLRRLGFWERPSDWQVMLYTDADRPGASADLLGDAQNWYLTRADADTDL